MQFLLYDDENEVHHGVKVKDIKDKFVELNKMEDFSHFFITIEIGKLDNLIR